jgi:hypothetical protein
MTTQKQLLPTTVFAKAGQDNEIFSIINVASVVRAGHSIFNFSL